MVSAPVTKSTTGGTSTTTAVKKTALVTRKTQRSGSFGAQTEEATARNDID